MKNRAQKKISRAWRKYKYTKAQKRYSRPNVAIGPYLGPVPKLTDSKMPKIGVNRFHFEDFGFNEDAGLAYNSKQGGCAYLGFADTGGWCVYLAAGAAIVRSMLARCGVDSPGTWTGDIDQDALGDMICYFRAKDHSDGSGTPQSYTITVGGQPVKAVAAALATKLFEMSQNNFTLYAIQMYEADNLTVKYRADTLADSILDIRIKTNVKFQNVTPADTDPDASGVDMNRNAINANPVSGVIYRFGDPVPRFKESVYSELTGGGLATDPNERELERTMVNITDSTTSNGRLVTRAMYAPTSGNVLPRYTCPPPSGKAMWANCTHQTKCHLQPGGYRNLAFVFNYYGTVTRFMQNIAANQDIAGTTAGDFQRLPKLGSSYLIGLEPAIRTTNNEVVRIAWNRDIDIKSSFKIHRKPQLPVRNCVTGPGAGFSEIW